MRDTLEIGLFDQGAPGSIGVGLPAGVGRSLDVLPAFPIAEVLTPHQPLMSADFHAMSDDQLAAFIGGDVGVADRDALLTTAMRTNIRRIFNKEPTMSKAKEVTAFPLTLSDIWNVGAPEANEDVAEQIDTAILVVDPRDQIWAYYEGNITDSGEDSFDQLPEPAIAPTNKNPLVEPGRHSNERRARVPSALRRCARYAGKYAIYAVIGGVVPLINPFNLSEMPVTSSIAVPLSTSVDLNIQRTDSTTVDSIVSDVAVDVQSPSSLETPITSTTETAVVEVEETVAPVAAKPKSLVDQIITNEISIKDAAGKNFESMRLSIPGACLDNIDIYGSNVADIRDISLQGSFFIPNGLLSPEEALALNSGTLDHDAFGTINAKFDPTYYVNPVRDGEVQVPCDAVNDSLNPPRWETKPKGTELASAYAKSGLKADFVQPVVELYLNGVLPGQDGNLIIAGHQTTGPRPFWNIDALNIGDTITFTDDTLGEQTYRMVGSEVAGPTIETTLKIENFTYPGSTRTAVLWGCINKGEDRQILYFVGVD